eukprot:CAMPEP_0203902288 /NCGR_PEP_ID=MMETSP0359-20131031/44362_1 /ASSEMBLY_ACC=CAM_ASM_000338 /TAXON_ID=268821 /ORGANISM="Scrippsiella Hangoei, Strain SHTV-5" /LENGTH=31 /DNA_ID= /DNA_START= /DNA_END= /DNA_ORIENTATION=
MLPHCVPAATWQQVVDKQSSKAHVAREERQG